ncbi:MAG: hypothetical protein PHE83_06220 [Opitutaceae bacterium]|nr:hypothetical protein [Opitutaceae bacterium]
MEPIQRKELSPARFGAAWRLTSRNCIRMITAQAAAPSGCLN